MLQIMKFHARQSTWEIFKLFIAMGILLVWKIVIGIYVFFYKLLEKLFKRNK